MSLIERIDFQDEIYTPVYTSSFSAVTFNSLRIYSCSLWCSLVRGQKRNHVINTLGERRLTWGKFDTDNMNFEPILNTTKNTDIGYEYF